MSKNTFSSISFNNDIGEKIAWRNLDIKERSVYLDKFIEQNFNEESNKKISKETIDFLKKKLQNKGLKTKKELIFDQVNKRIVRINGLIKDKKTNIYIYTPEILNKKNNLQKKVKNLLFKRKG